MNDPWKDVRERLQRAEDVEASDVEVSDGTKQYTADVRRVLSDADALLALKGELDMWFEAWNSAVGAQEEFNAISKLGAARRALPEYLRVGE